MCTIIYQCIVKNKLHVYFQVNLIIAPLIFLKKYPPSECLREMQYKDNTCTFKKRVYQCKYEVTNCLAGL